jgi:hypothetical protein
MFVQVRLKQLCCRVSLSFLILEDFIVGSDIPPDIWFGCSLIGTRKLTIVYEHRFI